MVDHLLAHPAIDHQIGTVDKVVAGIRQKEAGAGDVVGATDPAARVLAVIRLGQGVVILRLDPARTDGIDRDGGLGQRVGEGLGEGHQRPLEAP